MQSHFYWLCWFCIQRFTIHLINELRKENNKNLSSVVYALKSNIITEIIIVLILFVVLVLKSFLLSHFESSANDPKLQLIQQLFLHF